MLASDTGADGRFGPPVPVAGASGAVGGVAVAPGAGATIVWIGQTSGALEAATGVFAATRPPGGAFPATPELVAPLPALPVPVAAVAIPARGGRVQAAWAQYGLGVRVSRRG